MTISDLKHIEVVDIYRKDIANEGNRRQSKNKTDQDVITLCFNTQLRKFVTTRTITIQYFFYRPQTRNSNIIETYWITLKTVYSKVLPGTIDWFQRITSALPP